MAKKPLLSVYPGPFAEQVLVKSSQGFNLALQAFASLIARATRENESQFTPDEWDLLYGAFGMYDWSDCAEADPVGIRVVMPGILLKPAWRSHPANTKDLQLRLCYLDTLNAWALLWAVRFKQAMPTVNEWWKLEARVGQ